MAYWYIISIDIRDPPSYNIKANIRGYICFICLYNKDNIIILAKYTYYLIVLLHPCNLHVVIVKNKNSL